MGSVKATTTSITHKYVFLSFFLLVWLILCTPLLFGFDYCGVSPTLEGYLDPFITQILDSYSNSSIQGTRIFMESGSNIRYRYEYVLRDGFEKIVTLKMPYSLTWYRKEDRGYIIQYGTRQEMQMPLKDLEDVFVGRIASESLEYNYTEIIYTGIPAYYLFVQMNDDSVFRVILLQESLQIIRIERQKTDLLSVMVYDNLNQAEERQFSRQLNWYEAIPLADELGNAESAQETPDLVSQQLKIIETHMPYLLDIAEHFEVINTDLLEFSDGRAIFIAIDAGIDMPVGITIIQLFPGKSFHNIPIRLDDKVPQGYSTFQKRSGDFEITIIGEASTDYLEEICQHIMGLLPQSAPNP